MDFKRMELELLQLYQEAREQFKKCIRNEQNEFLKEELKTHLEDIILVEQDIKIRILKRNVEEYITETSLVLFAEGNEIGRYSYISNHKSEGVDDVLVFY